MNFNIPVESNIPTATRRFELIKKALIDLLDREAKKVLAQIRASMRGPKHGKIYFGKMGAHQASSPGEAPSVSSGALIRSLRARKSNGGMRIRISAEVKHGKFLEYGTKKMAARPFMGPAEKAARTVTLRDAQGVVTAQIRARKS